MMPFKSLYPKYYLKEGELLIMDKPAIVSTVLGSCIAVTLFNKRTGLAGICHALLPQCTKMNFKKDMEIQPNDECDNCPDTFRYADCAVFMMVEAFSRFGVAPQETEVRLFGGAKTMLTHSSRAAKYFVGRQNIETARMVLEYCHLTLASSGVGGSMGRKIIFNTKTGKVVQQFIKQTIFQTQKENTYKLSQPASGQRPASIKR